MFSLTAVPSLTLRQFKRSSNVFAWTRVSSESEVLVTSTEGIIILASVGAVALALLNCDLLYAVQWSRSIHFEANRSTKSPPGDGLKRRFRARV